jgi:hypothetical protein
MGEIGAQMLRRVVEAPEALLGVGEVEEQERTLAQAVGLGEGRDAALVAPLFVKPVAQDEELPGATIVFGGGRGGGRGVRLDVDFESSVLRQSGRGERQQAEGETGEGKVALRDSAQGVAQGSRLSVRWAVIPTVAGSSMLGTSVLMLGVGSFTTWGRVCERLRRARTSP